MMHSVKVFAFKIKSVLHISWYYVEWVGCDVTQYYVSVN